ncbi:MAG: ATP-dependent DNA helicase, partial [Armatimonadetes bacterium]|nr:ATP-dependent DNA helicase [Candidatus Hippobium faecium]
GVSSFWEGIDVKGDRLKLVVIDKIPFPVPTSPTVKSRCDFIDRNKGNSFMEYSVPSACIKLEQGFGRLIRTKTDRGVVAILDSRIHTKKYRREILNSIPRCKGTVHLEKVKDFLNNE